MSHGSGEWYFSTDDSTLGPGHPTVGLSLRTVVPEPETTDGVQDLGVGGTEDDPVLFSEGDPDTCPKLVLRKEGPD